jgi:hypothetical protein
MANQPTKSLYPACIKHSGAASKSGSPFVYQGPFLKFIRSSHFENAVLPELTVRALVIT